jgi:heterodisulfide reductase subunit C
MNQVLQSKFGVDHAGLAALRARIACCYTCSSCAAECPVNRMTNRLGPLKLVRLPEIWYCLMCRRCKHICPMTVKPSMLIDFLRRESVRQRVVPPDTAQRVKSLARQLHRIRCRGVIRALEGETLSDVAREWNHQEEAPATVEVPAGADSFRKSCTLYLGYPTNLTSCYTCCECSNSCPVFFERDVFDPLWIFRMAALGYGEELLSSPSIWLCLECGSCTEACGQRVRGHLVIRRIRELTLENGFAGPEFQVRWRDMEEEIYGHFLMEVDAVSGFRPQG